MTREKESDSLLLLPLLLFVCHLMRPRFSFVVFSNASFITPSGGARFKRLVTLITA